MKREFTFNKKPLSQVADYRPIWKIGQLLLVIKYGATSAGCSLLKIHLFSWTFQGYKNRQKLKEWINSDFDTEMGIWTLSPHVNRALAFAIGEKLIREKKGKYILTEKGNTYAEKIYSIDEAYSNEKKILNRYGKVVSDAKINKLAKDWK